MTLLPADSPPPLHYWARPISKNKPRVWPAYVLASLMLVCPLGLGLVVGICLGVFGAVKHWSRDDLVSAATDVRLMLGLMAAMALLSIVVAIAFWWLSRWLRPRLPLVRRPRAGLLSLSLLSLGAIAVARLASLVFAVAHMHSNSMESIAKMLTEAQQRMPISAFLLIGVLGPIGEELIFRASIQPRLIRRHGPWLGIIITSLFFGAYHMDLVQGIFAFLLGIYLGLICYRTGSVISSMLAHIAVNSSSCLLFYARVSFDGPKAMIPMLIAVAVVGVSSFWLLYRIPFMPRPR